jgi:hypothetical protein
MKRFSTLTAIIIAVFTASASSLMARTLSANWQESKQIEKREEANGKVQDARAQEKLARKAKITIDQARETALKRAWECRERRAGARAW